MVFGVHLEYHEVVLNVLLWGSFLVAMLHFFYSIETSPTARHSSSAQPPKPKSPIEQFQTFQKRNGPPRTFEEIAWELEAVVRAKEAARKAEAASAQPPTPKSLPLLEETLKLHKAKLGPEHPDTLTSMNNLGQAYRYAGKLDLALPLLEETLKLRKAKLGPEHPNTLISMGSLVSAYQAAGKLDLALPLLEETLKLRKAKLGPEHPNTLIMMGGLAFVYDELKQFDKAELLLREQLRLMKQKSGGDSPGYAGALAQLGHNVLHQKKWTDAEPLLRECLAIREKTQPDVWSTFNTKSLLGGALLGQKKYADAEPLLLAGYEGMKKREAKIPPQGKIRLTEALERLVQLYEATDNKDEAAKWRKELESSKAAQKKVEKK